MEICRSQYDVVCSEFGKIGRKTASCHKKSHLVGQQGTLLFPHPFHRIRHIYLMTLMLQLLQFQLYLNHDQETVYESQDAFITLIDSQIYVHSSRFSRGMTYRVFT